MPPKGCEVDQLYMVRRSGNISRQFGRPERAMWIDTHRSAIRSENHADVVPSSYDTLKDFQLRMLELVRILC